MATTQQTPPGTGPDLRKGDIDAAAKENMREGSLAPKVFIPAAVIMAAFIGITLAFPHRTKEIFDALQADVINYFGWYYVAIVAFFVIFALYLGFSRMGDVKLGDDDDEPEGAENDLHNLISLVRRVLMRHRQDALDGRYVLAAGNREGELAPWARPDEQAPSFAEAYVMTHWTMQGNE